MNPHDTEPFAEHLTPLMLVIDEMQAPTAFAFALILSAEYPSLAGEILEDFSRMSGWDDMRKGARILAETTGRY